MSCSPLGDVTNHQSDLSYISPVSVKGRQKRRRALSEHPKLCETATTTESIDREALLKQHEHDGEVHDLLTAILTHLPSGAHENETIAWINSILDSDRSYEHTLAEMGMLHYYISNREDFSQPLPDSLVQFRAEEMQAEIAELRAGLFVPEISEQDREIAMPGITHYILRAFSRMVLTSDQKFNLGGVRAILILLSDPAVSISEHLSEGHREHIICMCNNLCERYRLVDLLEEEIEVHKSMEDLIRYDLKLPRNASLSSPMIAWDLVLMLFFDIRQYDEGNCYVVSEIQDQIVHSPANFLKKCRELLKEGAIKLGSRQIFLRPLTLNRLNDTRVLGGELTEDTLLALDSFHHVLEGKNSVALENRQSLSIILFNTLKVHDSLEAFPHYQRAFLTFKRSSLLTMMVTAAECTYVNDDPCQRELLDDIASLLAGAEDTGAEESAIRKTLYSHVLFELDGQKEFSYNPDLQTLQYGNCYSCRELNQVSRFLAEIFIRTLRKSIWVNVLTERGALRRMHTLSEFVLWLNRKFECNTISEKEIVELYAPSHELQLQELLAYDLLLLQNKGGDLRAISESFFYSAPPRTIFLPKENQPCNENALDLIRTLYRTLPPYLRSRRSILASAENHAFQLTPQNFSHLWDSGLDWDGYLQSKLNDMVGERLSMTMPEEIKEAMVNELFPNEDEDAELRVAVGAATTYREISAAILDYYARSNPRVLEIIDTYFSCVAIDTIDYSNLFDTLGVSSKYSRLIHQKLKEYLPSKSQSWVAIPAHAKILRKILMEVGVAILPSHKIECILHTLVGLPPTLHLGDLNWIGSDTESPPHVELIARFHWGVGEYAFFQRGGTLETWKPNWNESFSNLRIYHSIGTPTLPMMMRI